MFFRGGGYNSRADISGARTVGTYVRNCSEMRVECKEFYQRLFYLEKNFNGKDI